MQKRKFDLDEKHQIEILTEEEVHADRPALILAHGAGNSMTSPFLESISAVISSRRINVIRFNFPYIVDGKKAPNRSIILENSWRRVIHWTIENLEYEGLYLGGKSMGARIATMVAADFPAVRGLVFLGYPLHPPGRFDRLRDEYLYELKRPLLFVQGTRDAFARKDLLETTLKNLKTSSTVHWIDGGEHSFKVLLKNGLHYPDILKEVGNRVSSWIESQHREK